MTDSQVEVGLKCPDCTAEFFSKGRLSAAFQLGAHRSAVHGYKSGRAKTGRPRGRPRQSEREEARPVLGVVGAMRDEIRSQSGPPTEAELSGALGRGLSIVSIAVASYAVETDPRELPDAEAEELVDYLSLKKSDATQVMSPLARTFHRTNLNKKYGRAIVENVEVVTSFAELAKLALHWRAYFRNRNEALERVQRPRALRPPPVVAEELGPLGAHSAAPGAGEVPTAEGGGVIWTPEMVAEARARNGQ